MTRTSGTFDADMKRLAIIALVLLTSSQSHSQTTPVKEANDAFVERISKQIAGHEQESSEKVFRNIRLSNLKDVPAARLLLIMNIGYSRALGVNCTYCHVEDDFSKDDKRPKRAAREMAKMHFGINQQLAKMENLEGKPEDRFINCATCHRGAIKPPN